MGKKTPQARAGSVSSGVQKSKALLKRMVPDVASMGALLSGGTAQKRIEDDGSLEIRIRQYCSNGSVYSHVYSKDMLYLMQFVSTSKPSPLYQFRQMVALYGATQNKDVPQSLEDIQRTFRATYVWTAANLEDVDEVGFQKRRQGMYISGGAANIKEFLMYFDDLLFWRSTHDDEVFDPLEKVPDVKVQVEPGFALALSQEADELRCQFEVTEVADDATSVFDLPPPTYPLRIVVMTFEMVGTHEAHIIFSGNTKPFQSGFIDKKIKGSSVKQNPSDVYGEYFRVLPNQSLKADAGTAAEVRKILGPAVLCSSPVVVRMKPSQHNTQALQEFLRLLANSPNVKVDVDLLL